MKILTSIIVSGIFYYICYWVTKDDSTRELIFASLIAIKLKSLWLPNSINGFPTFGYFKNREDAERAIELFGDEIKELFVDCEAQ